MTGDFACRASQLIYSCWCYSTVVVVAVAAAGSTAFVATTTKATATAEQLSSSIILSNCPNAVSAGLRFSCAALSAYQVQSGRQVAANLPFLVNNYPAASCPNLRCTPQD